jgi:RNA polymerase sigma factor (sigma-70 family)
MANHTDRSSWQGPCSIKEPEGLQELERRVHLVAWKFCRGSNDYDDACQDMMLDIIERQAKDPSWADNHPSYQIKYAMRRAQDLRRENRGTDVLRRTRWVSIDQPAYEDDSAPLSECLEGAEGSDQITFRKLAAEGRVKVHANLNQAVQTVLTPGQRDVIRHRFWMNQTTGTVARELDITKGTVCSQSSRAYQRLRQALGSTYSS